VVYYALVPVILLGISALLTYVGGRSRGHLAIVTLTCVGLLILADLVDPGRSGPLSWEWVLMSVAVPLVTAMTILVLAGAKAGRWVQVLLGAVAGFLGIVVCGILINNAGP
jgi:hypothetical protein